jgi:hypothetical protein
MIKRRTREKREEELSPQVLSRLKNRCLIIIIIIIIDIGCSKYKYNLYFVQSKQIIAIAIDIGRF